MQRVCSCQAPAPGYAPALTAPAKGCRRHASLVIAAGIVICALMTPPAGANGYSGNVTGECGVFGSFSYNVVASITGQKPRLAALRYDFVPAARTAYVDDAEGTTRYFQIAPGTYTVDVVNSANALMGAYSVTATSCSSSGAGMTWSLLGSNSTDGVVLVGCGLTCDAYVGDTSCATALPLLCILKEGPGLPLPASVNNGDIYDQWSGGIVGTTRATVPPGTLAGANALCAAEFGANWRVAEFHDGWGWNLQAYGYVGQPATRFWVHIDDQPGATCWH